MRTRTRQHARTRRDRHEPLAASFGVALMLALVCSGCAWRTSTAEHYFGPVFFRFNPGDGDEPSTTQVLAAGMLGEAGRQWGLSVGVVERIAVAPRYMKGAAAEPPPVRRWIVEPGLLPAAAPRTWNFSPVYLRVEGPADPPALVQRRLHGVQIVAGPEARAISVGVVSDTQVRLPDNAVSIVHYDSSAPLAARFLVWRVDAGDDLPPFDVLRGQLDETIPSARH